MSIYKCSRSVNIEVALKQGESADKLIKRFLKKCKKQDILKEHLEKVSFFRTNSQKRRAKRAKNKRLKENLEKKYGSKQ
jgi:ribosomal protein S21